MPHRDILKLIIFSGFYALGAALASVAICLAVAFFRGVPIGPVALTLSIVCPLVIAWPSGAFHRYANYRMRQARTEADRARAALEKAHLELRRLHNELVEKNRRDSLTGILNREAFWEVMAMLSKSEQTGALFIIDADHFKSINDTHGHAEGDAVLKAMTTAITKELPEGAHFGRIGGEEFAVFFGALSTHAAFHHAENIRLAVERLVLHTDERRQLRPTISLGGVLLTKGFDLSAALRHADENLYRAKHEGRNKTVIGQMRLAAAS